MQTSIILKERGSRKNQQKQSDERNLNRINSNISSFGNDNQKSNYQDLKKQYDRAKDPYTKEYLLGKMDRLESEVVYNSLEWLTRIFMSYNASSNYSDQQKASYWKEEGKRAIANQNKSRLLQAINSLCNLTIKSASESINVTLADLKK